MQKTITYLYPDVSKAANLKVFQDRTNQIKAFYFTKENIKDLERMESVFNYAVYFLFDSSDADSKKVYIGQSMNGITRIYDHVRNKDFWTYCLLFVTDNNSFDKLSIDYMEHAFIKKLKKSSFMLMNKDLRTNEPNISIYDRPNLDAYIEQIEFLLNAEGVSLQEVSPNGVGVTYYEPTSKKYKAKLFVKDGKFILVEGSVIRRPTELAKNWKVNLYERNNSVINGYLDDGKVEEVNGEIVLLMNIEYNSPSMPATLLSGRSENGWLFFKGLNELRSLNEGSELVGL